MFVFLDLCLLFFINVGEDEEKANEDEDDESKVSLLPMPTGKSIRSSFSFTTKYS